MTKHEVTKPIIRFGVTIETVLKFPPLDEH